MWDRETWMVRPQGHLGRSIDSRRWLSDDRDVRMFGVCGTHRLGKCCRCSLISIHRPEYQMHVNHKPLHVHCSCHKPVMIATESTCFLAHFRAALNVSTHSQSAPLTKCSLTLKVDFRDPYDPYRNICFDVLYPLINFNE